MKKLLFIFLILSAHFSFAQLNISLLSHLSYAHALANIGGYVDHSGNEYALVGDSLGLDIVDVTNPTNPVIRFSVSGPLSEWREVKTYRDYAYVTTESGSVGLQIIDLSNLPTSINTTTYKGDGAINGQINTIHALHIDTATAYLYLYGSNISTGANDNGYPLFFSLANPLSPHYMGHFIVSSGDAYVHDGYVQNDTAYFCHIYTPSFITVVNVADKANPVELATISSVFAHNDWLSNDHKTLFTTDEVPNSYLKAYDVTDLNNISLLSSFQTDPGSYSIVHNTHIVPGDFAVTSWYTEGVVIVDESRPNNPVEVGHYDTYPATNAGTFNGDWGVYPFLPSGNLVISDIDNGLYVLGPNYVHACWLEGIVTDSITGNPLVNATVVLMSTPNVIRSSNGTGNYYTGTVTPGTYTIQVSKCGYYTKTITSVSLTNGIVTTLNIPLKPRAGFTLNGSVVDSATGTSIPNAQIEFTSSGLCSYPTTCNASGNFSITLYDDTFSLVAGAWGYQTQCFSEFVNSGSSPMTIRLPRGYYDDFSFDFGWTVTGTSVNKWERAVPIGTYYGSRVINPNVDVSVDCEVRCYVTDNAGLTASDHDVDNGNTIVTSPNFDLTIYSNPTIDYYRWFIDTLGSGTPNDTMTVKLYNGSTTVTLETALHNTTGSGTWVHKTINNISSLLPLTSTMKLIVYIVDASPGHVVEGGFDRFKVLGNITTGINQSTSAFGELNAEGNPFYGSTVIDYSLFNEMKGCEMTVSDILGNVIEKHTLNDSSGKVTVGEKFSAGVYFVSLVNEQGRSRALKIVKAQ